MKNPALTAKAVFDHAHEIKSPTERQAYLDEACADSPELRQKVESLLWAYEEAGSSFLKSPALPLPATGSYQPGDETYSQPPDVEPKTGDDQRRPDHQGRMEGPGTQIGPYKLLKKLGEGGMGAVYLAEQEQPIRRQVALKIIKPGMDSAQVVARFEAERQALTMMNHVNIARVFDAGTTEMGRPYFVMELVNGIPVTRFCDENTLAPRERLTLFATICQAIQHAHQKGVIHRDIKPPNVLVAMQDDKPVPKVIDFGLAKATEQPLTDRSLLTQIGTIVGTLDYMSPEQADFSVQGVDTRTDVYSLGVMLYELLTGTTPLDRSKVRSGGFSDVLRMIKEEEPPKPSSRVSGLGQRLLTIAAQRKTEPAKLAKLLRGELDWIVMKALEKDRNRRFETASGFAKDVQRYLADEPVEAYPPSARYRLGKFARKHRTLLATAAGFLALLLLGVVGLTVGIVLVNEARRTAEAAEKSAVTEEKRAVTAEKRARKTDALTWAGIRAMTRVSAKLGETEKAILRNMQQAYRELPGEPDASRERRAAAAESAFRVASLSALRGEDGSAESGYRKAIELYDKLTSDFQGEPEYANEMARCYFDLASLLKKLGKRQEAEAAYRRAIEIHQEVAASFPAEAAYQRELADAYNDLGVLLREGNELAKAATAFRDAITLGEKAASQALDSLQYRIDLAAGYANLGNAVRDQGDAKAALAWYGKAIELLAPINPRPDDATLFLRNARWDRANAFGQLGRHAEASQDWQRAIDLDAGPARDHLRLFLATAQMEEKLKAQDKPAGELLYEAAALHARATAAAAATDEAGLQKQYANRAQELLKLAKTAGFFHDPRRIKQLQEDKAFNSLPPADFKPFLDSLEPNKETQDRSETR